MSHDPNDPTMNAQLGSEAWAYWKARRQVRALRGWYLHAMIYLGINALAWTRYLYFPFDEGSRFHHHAPLNMSLFWGVFLVIHGVLVWSRLSSSGRRWEERKIQEFMNRP